MATVLTGSLWSRSENATQLPSSPLQQAMTGVMFTVTALAFIVHCFRLYARISSRQIGLGMFYISI